MTVTRLTANDGGTCVTAANIHTLKDAAGVVFWTCQEGYSGRSPEQVVYRIDASGQHKIVLEKTVTGRGQFSLIDGLLYLNAWNETEGKVGYLIPVPGWTPLASGGGAQGPKGDTGATGPAGPQGIPGPQGPAGAPAEFVWVTSDLNPVTAYFYRDGVWTGRPLPISAVGVGVWACADPFNADRVLLIVNGAAGTYGVADSGGALVGASPWVYSPVWITEDAGLTWVPVSIPTPAGMPGGSLMYRATFSDQTANQWALTIYNGGTYYTAVVYGSGAAVTSTTETTSFSAPGIIAGAEGEFILVDTFNPPDFNLDYLEYVDSSIHRPAGTSVGNLEASADRLPGTSRAVLGISPDSGVGLVVTSDYRAAQPVGTALGAAAVSAGAVASYYTSSGALYRLIDPTGAATSTQIAAGATIKTEPRVDRQQRARAGLGVRDAGGGVTVLSDDGTVLISLVGPPVGHGNMSPAFEVIVRDV